jgi:hypothetical protein
VWASNRPHKLETVMNKEKRFIEAFKGLERDFGAADLKN